MSKAILVMDMPGCCADCNLACDDSAGLFCIPADMYFDGNDSSEEKPNWCPLLELPEKMANPALNTVYDWHDNGWNACLDALEGGREND